MSTSKLLVLYIVLVVLGVSGVLLFGLKPRAIQKIKLSNFENPQVMAQAVLMALRQDIKNTKLLFLGLDPKNELHGQFLNHFQQINTEQGYKYETALFDSVFETQGQSFAIRKEWERFLIGVDKAVQEGIRLLIVVPYLESPQMITDSIARKVRDRYAKAPMMSLTLSYLPRSKEDEEQLTIPCKTGQHDQSGEGYLGCMILQKARVNYRKQMKPGLVGLLDQYGVSDFVMSIK